MKKNIKLIILILTLFPVFDFKAQGTNNDEILIQFKKQISSFHNLNVNEGYTRFYKNGNPIGGYILTKTLPKDEIIIESPGTVNVGDLYLNAYIATNDTYFLTLAEKVAQVLIKTQLENGGWNLYGDTRINKDELGNQERQKLQSSIYNKAGIDDNITQRPINFLLKLYKTTNNNAYLIAARKGLQLLVSAQYSNGAFPPWYPMYNDKVLYSFNDGVIANTIHCFQNAYSITNDETYNTKIKNSLQFIISTQLPSGAWAEQYDNDLKPTKARDFEQPSACSYVTASNIKLLHQYSNFLTSNQAEIAINKACQWLNKTMLQNKTWARYYDLNTNEKVYYNRDGSKQNSITNLNNDVKTFVWESDFGITAILKSTTSSKKAKSNTKKTYNSKRIAEFKSKAEIALKNNSDELDSDVFTLRNFLLNTKNIITYLSVKNQKTLTDFD